MEVTVALGSMATRESIITITSLVMVQAMALDALVVIQTRVNARPTLPHTVTAAVMATTTRIN